MNKELSVIFDARKTVSKDLHGEYERLMEFRANISHRLNLLEKFRLLQRQQQNQV